MVLNHYNVMIMDNVLANKVSLETNVMNVLRVIRVKTVTPVILDTSMTLVKVLRKLPKLRKTL